MDPKKTSKIVFFILFICVNFLWAEEMVEEHVVMWGDTLKKLAEVYYEDESKALYLAKVNNIKNPDMIVKGMVLKIPPTSEKVEYQKKAVEQEAAKLEESRFVWRKEKNNVLKVGEDLEYTIRWQFIKVGSAIMQIKDIQTIAGRKCFHIYTAARSAPFFDVIYKVRNVNESWIDIESLCSLKFFSSINEGKVIKTETLIFDQPNGTYEIIEKKKKGEVPPFVQDVLSALYYLRTMDLEVGRTYEMDSHSGDTSWPLIAKIVKKQTIKVPAGKFDCLVVEPAIREGAGIFQAKGKLWVWITDDERKIPVKMSSKIPIGSIIALLKKIN